MKRSDLGPNKSGSSFGFRPVVYICSPYRDNVLLNTENARRYCRIALEKGAIPFAPHLMYPQFMDEETEEDRKLALFMGSVMLDKCAELWVFGKNLTEGMRGEIEKAKLRHKPIRFFDTDGKEVFHE